MRKTIVTYDTDGKKTTWLPVTIDQLGQNEEYLESVLAETPELLLLETKRTRVYGPYAIFRQLSFATPQLRQIRPDILLLAASGDVVIVEAKLFVNPELRDRRVIAQAIDYAASLSALSDTDLASLFSHGEEDITWVSLISSLFPKEEDPEELSTALLTNIKSGNIHIIIACDKAPAGLYELAKSVSVQSYLNFSLDILEVTPFLSKSGASGQVMFVPNTRVSTEIVARTAIAVTYQQGSQEPGVTISTTSMDEIEDNITSASQGRKRTISGRDWTDEEIENAFASGDDPIARDLFLFAKQYSYKGQLTAPGRKVNPSFGFYIRGYHSDGSDYIVQAFNWVEGRGFLKLYLKAAVVVSPEIVSEEYKRGLFELFGNAVDLSVPEPRIPIDAIDEKLKEFKALILKLQRDIESKVGQ